MPELEVADPGCLDYDSDSDDEEVVVDSSDDEAESVSEGAEDAEPVTSSIPDIQTALDFIKAVKDASLDNGDLDEETLARLRDPPTEPLDISDAMLRFSLDLYKSTSRGSVEVYNETCATYKRRHPDEEVLSHAAIKKKVAELSGVLPIRSEMRPDGCIAYTGPYADRDECVCKKPRYNTAGKAREFYTFPIGPQLQALFRSPESAKNMHYRREKTAEILETVDDDGNLKIPLYEGYLHGTDYLEAVNRGDIKDTDVVLIGSIDGAQLYRNKKSDCWISIWIVAELAPNKRFKVRAVLPDSIWPGPHKPKHTDSFKFPSLHHLSALQKEGLRIWDAHDLKMVTSHPFLLLQTADGPGMTCLLVITANMAVVYTVHSKVAVKTGLHIITPPCNVRPTTILMVNFNFHSPP